MRPLSHSSISLYLECPLKYKFKYIDGLKEKPKSYLSFGTSVHSALEFFFGSKFQNPPLLDEVYSHYKMKWKKEGYKDVNEEQRYFDNGKIIIKEFYEKHTNPYVRPLAVEHEILFEVRDVKVKAIIDRIVKIDDKSVEVVDYKTSRDPFTLTELMDEPQLTMYQLAIEKEMGMRVEKMTYYHLLSQTPFSIPRHKDENIELLKNRIVDTAKRIENKEFPYKENRYCPCDFGHLCPLYMHNYKKEAGGDKQTINIIKVVDEYGSIKDRDKDIAAKVDALQQQIKEYMEKEQIARVFGDKYEVTRSRTSQERLDSKKAKEVLQKHNLLEGLIKYIESETIRYREKRDKEAND